MKIGDTIKCHDIADMWSTRNKLQELGIYADPVYPLKKFTLKVWKVEEKQ